MNKFSTLNFVKFQHNEVATDYNAGNFNLISLFLSIKVRQNYFVSGFQSALAALAQKYR